jgi:hypothetical protein
MVITYFENKAEFRQKVKLTSDQLNSISGEVQVSQLFHNRLPSLSFYLLKDLFVLLIGNLTLNNTKVSLSKFKNY